MLSQSIDQAASRAGQAFSRNNEPPCCTADAGGLYQPRNRGGAEMFGEYRARACASRDNAAQEVAAERLIDLTTGLKGQ
jgi:hypothetical protein